MNINLGCGSNKIPNCINIDVNESLNPDMVCDFTQPLPFEPGTVDKCYFFHVIEHLREETHKDILKGIWNVLKVDGTLYLSYPEFTKCADNFINNKKGLRDFWKHTIYGRQCHSFDYHIALMFTPSVLELLKAIGFTDVEHKPEPNEDYNTMIKCKKGTIPPNIEALYREHWF